MLGEEYVGDDYDEAYVHALLKRLTGLGCKTAILTGIIARKREFAVLQSIGMTGKQLKTMLVYEGLLYALGAAGNLPGADPDFRPGGLQGGGEHVLVLHLPPDADPRS